MRGRLTDPVNVALHARREIVVDDKVDPPEVHSSTHELRADEHPHSPLPELLDDPFPLRRRPLRVDHIHMDPIIDQLVEQVICTRDGLHEDERRRGELAGGDGRSKSEQLARLGSGEGERLIDERGGGVLESNDDSDAVSGAEAAGDLLEGGGKGSGEEVSLQVGRGAVREYLVDDGEEGGVQKAIGLVEDDVGRAERTRREDQSVTGGRTRTTVDASTRTRRHTWRARRATLP